jgi:hypothetical protein
MMRHLLLLLCLSGLGACSNLIIPEVQADKVDCIYSREYNDITWSCDVEGTGQPIDIGIF